MSRAYQFWTVKEEQQLRAAWMSDRPMKEFMHLFGNRSYDAVLIHAHKHMGLGPRPTKVRSRYSAVWDSVERLLSTGVHLTARDIAERCKVSQRQVTDLLVARCKGETKVVHVATWRRPGAGWNWVEVWALGDGPDAVRPKAQTSADRNRVKRAHRGMKARMQAGGAFGAAIAQLAGVAA
jgi:hypothetical protein